MTTRPKGIHPELARAIVPLLDLVLSRPGIDDDTERRANWLRLRMVEIAPDCAPPLAPSFIDMRLTQLGVKAA